MTPAIKTCKRCGVEKPIEDFSTNGFPKDRVTQPRRPKCKACEAEFRRTNEDYKQWRRAWANRRYHADPKKTIERSIRWQREHREEYRARWNRWAKTGRKTEKHRTKALEDYRRRKFEKNPETIAYVDILLRDPCAYCGEPAGTIDHIAPLVKKGANDWTNLTAACRACNSWKRDKSLLTFLLVKNPIQLKEEMS